MRGFLGVALASVLVASGCGADETIHDADGVECPALSKTPSNLPSEPWAKQFGDTSYEEKAVSVATDVSGNVYVAGHFSETVDFGGGLLTAGDSAESFIASFGPDGSHRWSRSWTGKESHDTIRSITTGQDGNLYAVGNFTGRLDLGGATLTSVGPEFSDDIYVASFCPDGSHRWSQRFGDVNADHGVSIATDASGNVFLIGNVVANVSDDFDFDIYLASIGPDGSARWAKKLDRGAGRAQGTSVATDTSGNIYTTGDFVGTLDFGGPSLTSASNDTFDLYIASFGPDGSHRWSKSFVDPALDVLPSSVATDTNGNVYATGRFRGTVDLGGGPLDSAIGYDIYVASFGPDGAHRWSKGFGDVGYPGFGEVGLGNLGGPGSVATDPNGNVYVTGSFTGTVDFGGGLLTSEFGGARSEQHAMFVASFGTDGSHRWSRSYGDSGIEVAVTGSTANSVATDSNGNVYVTGAFGGTIDFGSSLLTSVGPGDIFLVKLPGSGP